MRHPANIARHVNRDVGQRAADRVTGFMGSWKFIGVQSAFILVWITLNTIALVAHWDAYPWILLNLLFSVQAAYASPLILLAQNRQVEHDRIAAEHDDDVNCEALRLIQQMHAAIVAQRTPLTADDGTVPMTQTGEGE
jgi:uncharacterized membrane protein